MKRNILIIAITALILAACAAPALAADGIPELPGSVEISKDNDISASFLSNLLGPSWRIVAGDAAADSLGGMGRYHGILVGLLGMVNLAAMTFISVTVLYHWGIFAVSSAHEGRPGGCSHHSLWTPVRQAVAFGLAVPVLNGLSLLQVVILACVSFSINFANLAWDWSGRYIVENSSYGIIDNSPPLIEDESLTLIQPLFQAVTVSELLRQRAFEDEGDYAHINQKITPQPFPGRVTNPADYKSVEIVRENKWVIVREPLAGAITIYPMPGRGMPLGQLGTITVNSLVYAHKDGQLLEPTPIGQALQEIAETRAQSIMDAGDELRKASRYYLNEHQLMLAKFGKDFSHKSGAEIAREYRLKVTNSMTEQVQIVKEGKGRTDFA